MFLIMGTGKKEKKLVFDQLVICKCCGKYGHLEVFLTYSYFMLFFIPIIKWNKHYYVTVSCCNEVVELDQELGKRIKKGEITSLNMDELNFTSKEQCLEHELKKCGNCGFSAESTYQFCPQCGKEL